MRVGLLLVALVLAGCAEAPAPASDPATMTTTTLPVLTSTPSATTPTLVPSTSPTPGSAPPSMRPPTPRCDPAEPFPCPDWDFDANGTPRFVGALHLDLDLMGKISRYRSGYGHSYTQGANETCRSLKHYFVPRELNIDPLTWEIRSPVDGRIVRAQEEHSGVGQQVWLRAHERPEFVVILFHVALDATLAPHANVTAGERIGHHASNQTANDVAVLASTAHGPRLVSYFDVMLDEGFAPLAERGLTRADLVIEQGWRDAHPMACEGEGFVGGDTSRDWLLLPEASSPRAVSGG